MWMNGRKAQTSVKTVAAAKRIRRGPINAPRYTVNGPMNIKATL
jgi:hypothetical protein